MVFLGAIAYALGLYLTSIATATGILYLSLGTLVGLGLSATSYVIVLGAVAKVVPAEHSAKAFGLTTAAGSFGMFAMIPGAQYLLSEFGWQQALAVFAALCSIMAAFALFMNTARGQQAATQSDQPEQTLKQALKEALAHRGYWLIHAGFFVCGFHVMFIATHLPSYLADKHLPASSAAMALAYVGIFNIFGSYFWGVMGDRSLGSQRRCWPEKALLIFVIGYFTKDIAMMVRLTGPMYELTSQQGIDQPDLFPLCSGLPHEPP